MNWTEPSDTYRGVSHYTHVISETPLGQCLIEWKGWKKTDSYTVTIGNEYVGEGCDLEEGKKVAKEWLTKKHKELSELLGLKQFNLKTMKIFKIELTESCYDCCDGYVIVANTEEEVRELAKSGNAAEGKEIWNTERVEVCGTYEGRRTEPFILMSSFNQG